MSMANMANKLRARSHARTALENLARAVRLDPRHEAYQLAHDAVRDSMDESKLEEHAAVAAGGSPRSEP